MAEKKQDSYYNQDVEYTLISLDTSHKGLSDDESKARLEKDGLNELKKGKKASPLSIFFSQFKDVLIMLLLVAIVVSFSIGEMKEAIGMIVIICISVGLGFIQEYRAEKAIEALEKLTSPNAVVIRNGREKKIPSTEVVKGDIIILSDGDIVPADSRLIEAESLEADESSLIGESMPVQKSTAKIDSKAAVSDQTNMVFSGSIITYGKGKAVVTGTAMNTEIGRIAKSISDTEESDTPLQKKFKKMTRNIGIIIVTLIALAFALGLTKGESVSNMLIFSLSLAVASVPSALPAIVTIGLSMGAKALAKKNMLVRKLSAAESLGSVSYICTDKTGTLTKNEMTVKKIFANNKSFEVTGEGYDPEGKISAVQVKKGSSQKEEVLKIHKLLHVASLCNGSKLYKEKGKWLIIGDPTEGSLLTLAKKGGFSPEELAKEYELVKELPFDSERKRMSVICKLGKDMKQMQILVKGAPEMLVNRCTKIMVDGKVKKLSSKEKKEVLEQASAFAKSALRVIGFAYKDLTNTTQGSLEPEELENNLILLGIAGMMDPPRPEVKKSIAECQNAGIGVMMITGDHPDTAKAIAEQIGLFNKEDIVYTGSEIEAMSDKELSSRIEKIRIIARALPLQKLKIIDMLKNKGHLVAMTGDGVNDAPALKKADIGVAMGITGSEVSKEVSKAVLADDNFASIVSAVEEGRNIYDKIIKSTKYLLSCNIGEILTVIAALIAGLSLPLLPLQLLLMNLVTDAVPAMGLGTESSEEDIMRRGPRNTDDNPLSRRIGIVITLFGVVMAAGTIFLFYTYLPELDKARTVAFTTLVMFEMFAVVSCRSFKAFTKTNVFTNKWLALGITTSILIQLAIIYVPALQNVLETVALSGRDWVKIIFVASIGFFFMEGAKLFVPDTKAKQEAHRNTKAKTTA